MHLIQKPVSSPSSGNLVMSERYYDTARLEILPWLPPSTVRVLDVGCGTGATTAAVKETRSITWAGGIEYDASVAKQAEPLFDRLWYGDAAQADLEAEIAPGSLDLVLCLDVLEHMTDPWEMVRRLSALIRPGGRLIVSVPNIQNWKFIWRLLTRGDFHYRDAGLLDRTHLRFFVRQTAVELTTCGSLDLVTICSAHRWRFPDARWVLSSLSAGRLDSLMAKQWLVVAEKRT
jgi:2-polyprenyl-3-methyl-5-hydroxy-6-metoxy-1,4-benzoquinol methylase